MTEDEARGKMCFRAATFAGSQQVADGPGPFCIGSACMAWRWIVDPAEIGGHSDYGFVSATINWGGVATTVKSGGNLVPEGYCGLAGKP